MRARFCITFSYDSTTGVFTVPPGADGWYYFYIYLRVSRQESCYFEIEVNGEPQCMASGEMNNGGSDSPQATCGVVTSLVAGNSSVCNQF